MPILPRAGQRLDVPPEIVVIQLLRRGRLEALDLAAGRIHAGHHVLDRAVFAGRVDALQDYQQGIGVLRIQLRLQIG